MLTDPKTMSSVFQAFQHSSQIYGDHPFLHIPEVACKHYSDKPIDLTYRQALNAIEECAVIYRDSHYGAGHRVALLLENRAAFFIHWLALNSLGCSVVPLNGDMQPEEIAYLLSHSESLLTVSIGEKIPLIEESYRLLDAPPPVIDIAEFFQLPEAPHPSGTELPDSDTECALLYTSGSTGKPKGCVLSNDYFIAFGEWYRDVGGICTLTPGKERLLTPLPLVHMNAMAVSTLGMIMTGGCIIQLDRFHPSSWWQTVRESEATIIHYLGVLPAILLNLPAGDDDFSKQIKFGFGAGVNPKHHALFEQRFGFPLIEAWAMTECGAGGTIVANREPRHVGTCCFGKAAATVEYQLVDQQQQPVAKGEPGELLVRATGDNPRRGFFAGYLKNPEATAEIWRGGWLHSGDVVRESADGSLHFVDRRKNVIRRSGENISALEVEAALAENPLIDQVVVTAVPDDIRGDEVMACIVTDAQPDQALAEQIVAASLATLAYYKVPGYIAFCRELPVTASQKPRRADVKTLAAELLKHGECFDTRHLKKRR